MRSYLTCSGATLALTLSCLALAQQPATPQGAASAAPPPQSATTPSPVAKLLETQVRAAWEAFKRKDRAGYAKFLTDDFQAVESDGDGERTRLHVLGEVEHCMYTSYLLQFFQVQALGPEYAIVTYESTMQFPRSAALRYRRVFIGELWTLHGGHWKMMRYQETPVH
jgi:Domain of unknown function (DUF4440)